MSGIAQFDESDDLAAGGGGDDVAGTQKGDVGGEDAMCA